MRECKSGRETKRVKRFRTRHKGCEDGGDEEKEGKKEKTLSFILHSQAWLTGKRQSVERGSLMAEATPTIFFGACQAV